MKVKLVNESLDFFKSKILSKPRIIKKHAKIKYLDDNNEYRYGIYIRDTIMRGEWSASSLFSDVISIIEDDEIGRTKIEKNKLEEI